MEKVVHDEPDPHTRQPQRALVTTCTANDELGKRRRRPPGLLLEPPQGPPDLSAAQRLGAAALATDPSCLDSLRASSGTHGGHSADCFVDSPTSTSGTVAVLPLASPSINSSAANTTGVTSVGPADSGPPFPTRSAARRCSRRIRQCHRQQQQHYCYNEDHDHILGQDHYRTTFPHVFPRIASDSLISALPECRPNDLILVATNDTILDSLVSSLDHVGSYNARRPIAAIDTAASGPDQRPLTSPPSSRRHTTRHQSSGPLPPFSMNRHDRRPSQSNAPARQTSSPVTSPPSSQATDLSSPQDAPSHSRNHSLTSSIRLPKFLLSGHHTSRNPSIDNSISHPRQGSKSSTMAPAVSRSESYDANMLLGDRPGQSSRDANSASILSRGRPVPSTYSLLPATPVAARSDLLEGGHASPLSSNPNYPRGYRPSPSSPDATAASPTSKPRLRSPKSAARERASEFVRINSMQDVSLPQQSSSSASHLSHPPGSMQRYPNLAGADEKRGFFKRVFFPSTSSSRSDLIGNMTPSATVSPIASRSNSVAQPPPSAGSPHMSPSEFGRQYRESSVATQSSVSQLPPQHQLLNKKSSFFRRRKKSFTDSGTPPALPAAFLANQGGLPASSSLYQAMNPYISPDPTSVALAEPQPHISEMDSHSPPRKLKVKRRDRPASPGENRSSTSRGGSDRQLRSADSAASPEPSLSSPNMRSSPLPPSTDPSRPLRDPNMDASPPAEFVLSKGPPEPMPPENRLWLRASIDDSAGATPSELDDTPLDETVNILETDRIPKDELGLAIQSLDTVPVVGLVDDLATKTSPKLNVDASPVVGSPDQDEDKIRARQIFNGDESVVKKDDAAAYLGDVKMPNVATLKYYIRMFDFTGKTILWGLRILCDNLILKAETQAVDRILQAFSDQWFAANPRNGFKLTDVVHTMCYSLLLLNTDLHMADIETKMTRGQFVKNTLPNIKRIVTEATMENENRPTRPSAGVSRRPSLLWKESSGSLPTASSTSNADTPPIGPKRPGLTKRLSSTFDGVMQSDQASQGRQLTPANAGAPLLVDDPFDGKLTEWYAELEAVLKSFFTAIKHDPLPLNKPARKQSVNLLSVGAGSVRRAPSIKSMTPSETMSMRSKKTDFHSMTSRWGKGRFGRNRMYASSTLASSRTSFEDSSAWSKYSVGRTATTMSTGSYANAGADQSFHQSIGFANALSHAYFREDGSANSEDDEFNAQRFLLEDETLELAGAPWAKEGMVKHKYHLEAKGKKAKDRDWSEGFAVIEKGYLRLFSFNSKGGKTGSLGVKKSAPPRGKAASIAPSVVGGGNWMQNAEQQACFLLRQTIASTLPPPGYSKARPHVWALSLPTGAVHLFQVGTPQIAEEFKTSANYWSARLSKEPLTGGFDNIEYGWSDNVINTALISNMGAIKEGESGDTAQLNAKAPRHSNNNSVSMPRPSHDQGGAVKTKTAGDRAHIEDWKPPAQSMMASQLMAVDQLRALKDYVRNVEKELSKHNDLRTPMDLAYSPRHSNHTKALANWEKKSSYLLREIVKFTTYTDALEHAEKQKALHDREIAERVKMREEREAKQAKKAQEAAAAAAASTITPVPSEPLREDADATPRQSRFVQPVA